MNLVYKVVWLSVLLGCALSVCAQSNKCTRAPVRCVNASTIQCSNLKYRTFDGSCNNPIDPTLGMPLTAFQRLLPSAYEDGIYSMRLAKSGNPLPSARLLAYAAFGRKTIPDPVYTLLNMQWGQIVAHDSSNRLFANIPGLEPAEEKQQTCCTEDGNYETRISPPCFPIPVPDNDPFFTNRQCLDFDRSVTDKDQKCSGTESPVPAEQISGVTHYMDLSIVYGNSVAQNQGLRTLTGGLLKTKDGKFPPQTNTPEAFCIIGEPNGTCYDLGDFRGNQNTGLTMLQITLLLEHNRIAQQLSSINPHWNDEKIFQEARRINTAQYQYITYYEWIVNTYGSYRSRKEGLTYTTLGGQHVNDYDECADPRSLQSFMHSAFRYLHTQIMGKLKLFTELRTSKQSINLLEHIDSPGILEQPCKYSQLIRGLSTQAQDLTDNNFDFAAAEKFVIPVGAASRDLRSFDIQRDRDHGLPPYNDFREYCGLKRATSWNDFRDYMSSEDIALLKSIYESHEDVDLTIGGSLERHEPDALLGPIFLCIGLQHFKNQRKGDRYFFENGKQPYPFTSKQLREIRKASAARILCDNSPVKYMQPNAFKKISLLNPLLPCSLIDKVNLLPWKEENSNKPIVKRIRQRRNSKRGRWTSRHNKSK